MSTRVVQAKDGRIFLAVGETQGYEITTHPGWPAPIVTHPLISAEGYDLLACKLGYTGGRIYLTDVPAGFVAGTLPLYGYFNAIPTKSGPDPLNYPTGVARAANGYWVAFHNGAVAKYDWYGVKTVEYDLGNIRLGGLDTYGTGFQVACPDLNEIRTYNSAGVLTGTLYVKTYSALNLSNGSGYTTPSLVAAATDTAFKPYGWHAASLFASGENGRISRSYNAAAGPGEEWKTTAQDQEPTAPGGDSAHLLGVIAKTFTADSHYGVIGVWKNGLIRIDRALNQGSGMNEYGMVQTADGGAISTAAPWYWLKNDGPEKERRRFALYSAITAALDSYDLEKMVGYVEERILENKDASRLMKILTGTYSVPPSTADWAAFSDVLATEPVGAALGDALYYRWTQYDYAQKKLFLKYDNDTPLPAAPYWRTSYTGVGKVNLTWIYKIPKLATHHYVAYYPGWESGRFEDDFTDLAVRDVDDCFVEE